MKIETKFNREQSVVIIFDNELYNGTVDEINIKVGFKNKVNIEYNIKLKIDNQVLYETFSEDRVFIGKEDFIKKYFDV